MPVLASIVLAALLQQEPERTQMRVQVNGEDVTFAVVQPFVKNGHTLIPVRGVLEKIGAHVDYDAKTRRVNAYKKGVEIVLTIGENRALVNGEEMYTPLAPQIVSGSTMLPLRFICEALGAEVSYDKKAHVVNIYVPQHEDDLIQGTPPPL